MKKYLAVLSTILISVLSISHIAFAANHQVKIGLNHAYPKPDGTYAIVVKDVPGVQLALYINDKNPVYATVNKKDWATFRGVKLTSSTGKVSFGRIFRTSGNTYQKPLRYVRYFDTDENRKVVFSVTNPTPPVEASSNKPPSKTVVKSITHPVKTAVKPAPQPSCTNGTYVNTAGNTVCRPEASPSAPVGATARCVDGTYSFSPSHSGTCSHHGGVSTWL